MNAILTKIQKTGRVAVIALALGASSLTAAPAFAQSGPSVNFSLEFGSGGGSFSTERRGRDCLTDRQIRRGLRDIGFRDISFGRNLGRNRVEVIAEWENGRDYSMRVNRCTGRVDRVQRLRRGNGGGGGNGIELELNF